MDALITIEGTVRTGSGKSYNRKLRRAGKIPANLMVKGQATALELDPKWLSRAYKTTKKFNLTFNGATKTVVIKELQVDAVKRTAVHVDLMYEA